MALMIRGLHIEEIVIDMDPEENQPEPIEAEPLQEEPEKSEPKKTAPKKNTKPIDKGKIGALHRAGWSASKIADEMKLGLSTVYKIIKEIQEANK